MLSSCQCTLPNEDFGRMNKRWNPDFEGSTFQGREYSIWATNHRKVSRKSGFHLLFLLPKSSFGEHHQDIIILWVRHIITDSSGYHHLAHAHPLKRLARPSKRQTHNDSITLSSTDTHHHDIIILSVRHAIIMLSPCEFDIHIIRISSSCVSSKCASSCYHVEFDRHIILISSSCEFGMLSSSYLLLRLTCASSCYHHLLSSTDTSSWYHLMLIILWVRTTHRHTIIILSFVWVLMTHRDVMLHGLHTRPFTRLARTPFNATNP